MWTALLTALDRAPRRVFMLISLTCVVMLAFGLFLQHSTGLEPCPMCIVQRYALVCVAVIAAFTASSTKKNLWIVGAVLLLMAAFLGAFVAARQSWLQWYPPQVATCGRDFYGMIESFPLQRVIPMIFKGSGDCAAVDWSFLGGTIANWSFVCFTLFAVLALAVIWRTARRQGI
ncbi:MAG: disulfide bond formation protein B [Rhodoferax sp.]|nr:disulfide bond formation protein B [Rhodoferax sp.]